MPSFDVISEVDQHELTNAVDQTNREIGKRFDFKGTEAQVDQNDRELTLIADEEFQIKQILEILRLKMANRKLDVRSLELGEIVKSGKTVRMTATAKHGIDKDMARKIVKLIKDMKIKVQSQIQGDQVRVSGKKRDDLQAVMAMLREVDLGQPVQFTNFRD